MRNDEWLILKTVLGTEMYLIFWSLAWKMKSMHEILLNFLYFNFHVLFIRLLRCYPNTTACSVAVMAKCHYGVMRSKYRPFSEKISAWIFLFPYSSNQVCGFRNALRKSQEHKQSWKHIPKLDWYLFWEAVTFFVSCIIFPQGCNGMPGNKQSQDLRLVTVL